MLFLKVIWTVVGCVISVLFRSFKYLSSVAYVDAAVNISLVFSKLMKVAQIVDLLMRSPKLPWALLHTARLTMKVHKRLMGMTSILQLLSKQLQSCLASCRML